MKRRLLRLLSAYFLVLPGVLPVTPSFAIDEADRLWMVGERASNDGLHALARRMLERFVEQNPKDPRLPEAVLLLGRARLAEGAAEPALEAFRRAQTFEPVPGRPLEAKFWEAEALLRLHRLDEARNAFDGVLNADAASPFAPDAAYGLAWIEIEAKRPQSAIPALQRYLWAWPDHALAGAATFYLARTLAEQKRYVDALPLLQSFPTKFPNHRLIPDAQYMLGWTRVSAGDGRAGLADLRAFVQANPSHELAPAARRLITEAVTRYGDREELLETYRSLMAQNPPTPEALSTAAGIAGRLGRAREQESAWRRLNTEFADHPLGRRAALDLGTAAFKRKDWKSAVAFAQAATASTEDITRAESWLLVGESQLKLKQYAAATKAFESVLAVKNVDAGVRYRALAGLGLAHEEQEQWRAALMAYESVASRSPDGTLRDWARERANAVKARAGEVPAAKPKKGS